MQYLDTKTRGKFIVLYGPNNIGKSTQIGMLASRIITEYHEQVLLVKYPIYGLEPTGPEIKRNIKNSSKSIKRIPDLDLQKVYAQNRKDFQHVLEICLKSGVHVIAEDYIGTGIAWGMTKGIEHNKLLEINNYLLIPDVSILLDGERFKGSIEKHHIFENAGDEVWNKNRKIHLKLAKIYKWKKVRSDNPKEKVHEDIWKVVNKEFKLH